jgi:iron uptake system component EfeO
VRRFVRPARLASAGLGVAVALAACGGNPAASGPALSLPPGTYAVEARRDYSFSPSTLTVPAGEVTFRVTNTASEEHEFEIFQGATTEGEVEGEVEGLVPGLTKDLTLPLAAGTYTYVCKLNGHDQLGMKGTLTVTGS